MVPSAILGNVLRTLTLNKQKSAQVCANHFTAWECVHVCVQPSPVGAQDSLPFTAKFPSVLQKVHSVFQNVVFYLINVSSQQYTPQIYLLKLTH